MSPGTSSCVIGVPESPNSGGVGFLAFLPWSWYVRAPEERAREIIQVILLRRLHLDESQTLRQSVLETHGYCRVPLLRVLVDE